MKRIAMLGVVGLLLSAQCCKAEECVVQTCNAGYYATTSFSRYGKTYYSKCQRCPSMTTASGGTQYGTTSAGLNLITACTIGTGISFKDTTGTYEFTSACTYKN